MRDDQLAIAVRQRRQRFAIPRARLARDRPIQRRRAGIGQMLGQGFRDPAPRPVAVLIADAVAHDLPQVCGERPAALRLERVQPGERPRQRVVHEVPRIHGGPGPWRQTSVGPAPEGGQQARENPLQRPCTGVTVPGHPRPRRDGA